jgi:RNA polymerase sigma-70 factor, ECF subfamily
VEALVIPTAGAIRPRCQKCEFHVAEICDSCTTQRCGAPRSLCGHDSPSDEDLVRRHRIEASRSAPRASFGMLFDRHYRHVVAWACRMSGSYDLARDLAQDVFVKVLTRIDAFRGDSRFTTWLYIVTRNTYRDYVKACAAVPRDSGSDLIEEGPVTENEAIATLDAEQAASLVRRLMRDARLDPIEARAFRLHYAAEMPLEAVTARLGLTNPSGARAHIVSAKRKLRRSLERSKALAAHHMARAAHASSN